MMDGRTWMGPAQARNGVCPVKARTQAVCGPFSLAAEPAVHEDHTQFLSQIPHRSWFWAPTDTRFGGKWTAHLRLPYAMCSTGTVWTHE